MRLSIIILLLLSNSLMLIGQVQQHLELGLRLNQTNIQSLSFSPYVKSGLLPGVFLAYEKMQERPWHLQIEFQKGNLNSAIDEGDTFYELFDFAIRYTKLFPVIKDKMWIGGSLTALDGIVGRTPFINNSILHDVSMTALGIATLNSVSVTQKVNIENRFSMDLAAWLSRNEFSSKIGTRYWFSTPLDRINLNNQLRCNVRFDQHTVGLGYQFSMIRNFANKSIFSQHSMELAYIFHFGKTSNDEN
ncbi:MAG: hypothetical protein AAGI23_21270 [Bacteroidota bacterium]